MKKQKARKKLVDPFTDNYPKVTITKIEGDEFKTYIEIGKAQKSSITIASISDTHGEHLGMPEQIPECDILVHAGDFSMTGTEKVVNSFVEWLLSLLKDKRCQHIVVITGNHDRTFHEDYYHKTGAARFFRRLVEKPNEVKESLIKAHERIHYLEDESIELLGIKFYGSRWSPLFCDFDADQAEQIARIWAKIPLDTDILITHCPPVLHGDKTTARYEKIQGGRRHVGCFHLYDRVIKVKPVFHIFGHIHEGYGVTKQNGLDTIFINASTCNLQYRPLNKPILSYFDPAVNKALVDDEKKEDITYQKQVICCCL